MRLHSIVISYSKDADGVTKPLQVGHAKFLRDASDGPEILFDAGGVPKPRSHMVAFDLEAPKPEDDPNANISASDVETIKSVSAEHARGGVIVPVRE